MRLRIFQSRYLKTMFLPSLFLIIYDNKKSRASDLKILEHIKTALFVLQFMHHAVVALSWNDFTWLSSFLEWLKSRGRRCWRPAPLKCCIYYKVEPVLVLGKPRPTKGDRGERLLDQIKENSVRGWRRPRSAALYALFHHRFFLFTTKKYPKFWPVKIGTRIKRFAL